MNLGGVFFEGTCILEEFVEAIYFLMNAFSGGDFFSPIQGTILCLLWVPQIQELLTKESWKIGCHIILWLLSSLHRGLNLTKWQPIRL